MMSAYGFYLNRIRRAAAMVSEVETALARSPDDIGLRMTLRSAEKLAERAEREFSEIARKEQLDICRYRMVPSQVEAFPVTGVARSLEAFQELFSFLYEAISKGPRQGGGLRTEQRQETSLEFGYSFSGSLGVVLIAPSESGFFFSKFDPVLEVMDDIFNFSSEEDVKIAARKVGKAPIQKAFDWAKANFSSGFSVDINWINTEEKHKGQYIEWNRFERITGLIGRTSEKDKRELSTLGTLVGFNSLTKTFHFVEPEGESYKGTLSDEFPKAREWTVNRPYRATIVVETTTQLATGQETKRYLLRRLQTDHSV